MSTIPGRLLAAGVCAILAGGLHAQVVSPRQLVEVADISHPGASPDGSMVAYRVEQPSVERNTHDTVWYVQRIDGTSPPRKVAEAGPPLRESDGATLVPMPAVWSPDGRHIYYRALMDGRVGVWRAAADGSNVRAVTSDPADVRDFQLGPDGRVLMYSVGATRDEVAAAEQAEYDNGILIDETVPIGQGLFRSGYLDQRWMTQRLLDSDVMRSPLLAQAPDRWKAVDLATGRARELAKSEVLPGPETAVGSVGGFEPLRQAQDGRTGRIAILAPVEEWPDTGAVPEVALSVLADRETGRFIRCRAGPCTEKAITGLQWRPGSHEVLFTVTDPDESHAQSIFRWDVETGEVSLLVRSRGLLNGGRVASSPCAVTAEAMVCVAADANRPPRLERVDLASGRRKVMFDPNAAIASDMASVAARLLVWKDAQGRQFNGLYYPVRGNGGASPLFITYYWCSGFVRGGLGDEWPLATLAGLGISALCINAPPGDTDAVSRFELGRSAVESAVDLLDSKGEVDRTRIGMGGLSHGTEVTLWVAMNSDMLSAASVSSIAFSPLAHALMSMQGEVFFSRLSTYWQLGTPDETPGQWKRLSPAFNIESIRTPILMQLPEQEYLHSVDYAVPLIRSGSADLYVYPNEAHQKFQPRHKLAVYERNVDWFQFWLKNFEDPDPAKASQYARWRSMRDVSP
ncbi:Atxe2 family lasso peptide isopeptidase [Luteimonas sp. BDR2-5]|uniref:Atxe2 family lasso peptide isopeptidase n=1 Tax=Proluteimonas luteida TaxID=2878685 RepID=UPI001E54AEA4|nr:Atxe2 family lasso peptide isopeptidase [Luteimonas sp. BDR2-5]MCD9027838.1 Atxe2 family lasso peptide isopeptidase [Luteimonas sp. BDR2-5]